MNRVVHRKCPGCGLVSHTGEPRCRLCGTVLTEAHVVFQKSEPVAQPIVQPQVTAPKSRNGCLTLYLGWMLIGNAAGVMLAFVFANWSARATFVVAPVLSLLSMLMVVFVVALLRWKRWGLWGILGLSVLVNVFATIIGAYHYTIGSVLGVMILFTCLMWGGSNSAWNQLE